MSAAKRRIKRKIALLVRMDATHYWCQMRRRARRDGFIDKAARISAAMVALARPMHDNVRARAIEIIKQQRAAR